MTIRTERLLLREWREEDRDAWAALNADPEVMRYFPSTYDRAKADASFDQIAAGLAERGWGLWAVDLNGEFLGFTGLAVPRFEAHFTPATEVGWRLARHAWGHGYATEAARAAVALAFDELELAELVSMTAVQNAPSRRVMERLGMTRNAADDFDHPNVTAGTGLQRHVLYRLGNPSVAPRRSAAQP